MLIPYYGEAKCPLRYLRNLRLNNPGIELLNVAMMPNLETRNADSRGPLICRVPSGLSG